MKAFLKNPKVRMKFSGMYLAFMSRVCHAVRCHEYKKVYRNKTKNLTHVINLCMGKIVFPTQHSILILKNEPTSWQQDAVYFLYGLKVESP